MAAIFRLHPRNRMTAAFIGPCTTALTVHATPGPVSLGSAAHGPALSLQHCMTNAALPGDCSCEIRYGSPSSWTIRGSPL